MHKRMQLDYNDLNLSQCIKDCAIKLIVKGLVNLDSPMTVVHIIYV